MARLIVTSRVSFFCNYVKRIIKIPLPLCTLYNVQYTPTHLCIAYWGEQFFSDCLYTVYTKYMNISIYMYIYTPCTYLLYVYMYIYTLGWSVEIFFDRTEQGK